MAARRKLGFVIADIGQQQRVLHCHAARRFEELDKLLDAERFLIGGARTTCNRETVRRGDGLHRPHRLAAGSRKGAEDDCGRERKSGKEAGASRGQGGLLILVLELSISRVGASEGSLTLTKTLPPRLRAAPEAPAKRR